MTTIDPAHATTAVDERAARLMRWLVVLDLVLVALQPVSAGFFLSGYGSAVEVHAVVSVAVQLGVVLQAAAAIVLWRRRRLPGRVARHSIALLVIVFVQVGLGHHHRYWLHLPLGVAIFGWLVWWSTSADGGRRRR